MNRFTAITAALGLSLWSGCSSSADRPNIIVVLTDTLRADYLGTYGFQGDISRHIDELAGESVVFENCFTQAPWTKPSTASLFTSTYPRVHQLTNHKGMFWSSSDDELFETGVLPNDLVTLAEGLKAAGYQTGGFVANPWITGEFGFSQGFDRYYDEATGRALPADIFLEAARDWLDEISADQPFFLYLHLMDVHDPFEAPYTDARALRDSPSLGAERQLSELPPSYLEPGSTSLSVRHWRSRYAANVREYDRRLSFFVDELRHTGILDESYLVFTSDHGEELYEHGHWAHGYTLHHHQVHVPLFIRAPDAEHGGEKVTSVVQNIDLMPTLVSLAGAEIPASAQGKDLSGFLRGVAPARGRYSFASAARLEPGRYSVRSHEYNLIKDLNTQETWLYDLENDPGELYNLAQIEPKLREKLEQVLVRHLKRMEVRGGIAPETRTVDDERIEQLRALGYVR